MPEHYTDEELQVWFDQVALGYSFEQACERVGYSWIKLQRTFYKDRDVLRHAMGLCMYAGALIEDGTLAPPDRSDGLYDKYKTRV